MKSIIKTCRRVVTRGIAIFDTTTNTAVQQISTGFALAFVDNHLLPYIYSCDTDVLVLALRRVPDLKPNSVIIMGTGDRRRQIKLKPIHVALGAERAAALPGFHSVTGSNTTGHIKGKGKSSCFKVFMKVESR